MKQHLGAAAAIALAACGPEPTNSEAVDEAELNGTVIYSIESNCSSAERSRITSAFGIAANQVRSSPSAMRGCLSRAVLSADIDAYAEEIVARLGEDMPTYARCRDIGWADAQGPLDISFELVTFDHADLASSTSERTAALLLHEVAHNKGYYHHDTEIDSTADESSEYAVTIPEQLKACSQAISAGEAPPDGNSIPRTSVAERADLAPIGRGGGTSFEAFCGSDNSVSGLDVQSGNAVDSIFFTCRIPNGPITGTTGRFGGTGGNLESQSCLSNEVAVGFAGTADITLNSLGLLCQPVANVRAASSAGVRTLTAFGSSSGHSFTRRCPAGMAIKGAAGRAATRVDRLRPVCQEIDLDDFRDERRLPRQGGLAGNEGYEETYTCPGRSAIYLLDGSYSTQVWRMSARCRDLSDASNAGGEYQIAGSASSMIEGTGGWDGRWARQSCTAGQVAIGLFGSTNSDRLTSVGLVCASAQEWSRSDYTPVIKRLTRNGTSSGTQFDTRCNRAEYLAGWKLRTGRYDGTFVSFVEPVCRSFGTTHTCQDCTNTLTVNSQGPLGFTSTPSGLSCANGTCSAQFGTANTVRLTPNADTNTARFIDWTSTCPIRSNRDCLVPMSVNRTVTLRSEEVECNYAQCRQECLAECEDGPLCNSICNAECADCL